MLIVVVSDIMSDNFVANQSEHSEAEIYLGQS